MGVVRRSPRAVALLLLVLCTSAVLAVIAGRAWLQSTLRSERFRKFAGEAAGNALKADGAFEPLQISGATVYSGGFVAKGKPEAAFGEIRADELRAEFRPRALFRRVAEVEELDIQRLSVELRERSAPALTRELEQPPATRTRPSVAGGWRFDLRKALVREARLSWRDAGVVPGEVSGVALTFTPSDAAWMIEARQGRLAQTGWPELRIESARMRWDNPTLFISDSELRHGDGRIAVTGEVNFDEAAELNIVLARVSVTPLLPEDWRVKLTGAVSGNLELTAPLSGKNSGHVKLAGALKLTDGELKAVPVLDQIAVFTRTERFRRVALSNASVEIARDGETLAGRNLVAESPGLLRVEGDFVVRDGMIEGTFRVGVTPSSLQWLPGSQERVFTGQRDGYAWTDVRLSGPAKHPKEDLTARLVAAAGHQLLDDAQGAAKDLEDTAREAAKGVLDLLLR